MQAQVSLLGGVALKPHQCALILGGDSDGGGGEGTGHGTYKVVERGLA